ncbi:MAG: 30S ribosomal protein S6, partial [Phycisphaerae bacterium]|nr:30S ribosomal protein S6 [Phycisphaerae bacterium]
MKRYEAMFLFDNTTAYEWPAVEQEVNRLVGRIGAQLLACVKFDERKLAFEIRGRKRGTYVLTYMEAPPERIGEFERDAHLSEAILRVLVLRAENLTPERLAEIKAWPADKPLQPLAADGRREGDRGGWRGGDRGERSERGDRYGDRDRDRDDRQG